MLGGDLVEVHEKENSVFQNINLNSISKLYEIEYCQAELGGVESTDSLANKRVEDSSVEVPDTSFREGAGASNTLGGDLVEVYEKGN